MKYAKDFVQDLFQTQGLRIQAREEFLNASAYNVILTNSFFSRESILRAYGLDARVCYLGIDTDLFRPLNLPRERMVIGVEERVA